MTPKIQYQGEQISIIASLMSQNPNDFMIDTDGKLYSKCPSCTEWHLISHVLVVKE